MKRRAFLQSTAGFTAALASSRVLLAAEPTAKLGALDAVKANGAAVTLQGAQLEELRDALRGRLLTPQSEGYEEARRVRNPVIDRRPALIVQTTGVADVRTAVDFARANELLLAVKSGGHSFSGQSTCDRGMVIDLGAMSAAHIDPATRTAWVAGGTLLGLLDHEAMSRRLVTPMGTVGHTGVGGLTTGGGFGRLARRFGLALDNVVAMDVVSADGKVRHASATENSDLFWAVRGGGGNFGIVTGFRFQLHPMQRQVVGGGLTFPFSQARKVLDFYADYSVRAPDELSLDCYVGYAAGNKDGVVGFNLCYSGEHGAEQALAPIRRLGKPTSDTLKSMDYVALQGSNNLPDPRPISGGYIKAGLTAGINPNLIAAILDSVRPHPKYSSTVSFQHAGGAIGRVPADATAFAHRYVTHNMLTFASWKLGEPSAEPIAATRQLWSNLDRHTRGFYVNDMGGDEGAAQVHENYREHYPRLVKIKNQYDPGNLFRLNANIKPAAGA